MHFLGMSALTLRHPVTGVAVDMQFSPILTVFSAVIAVACMRIGFKIMEWDCFSGPKRADVLRAMLHTKITSIEKTRSAEVHTACWLCYCCWLLLLLVSASTAADTHSNAC
jgi:Bacterial signalling protein N terminal repeat